MKKRVFSLLLVISFAFCMFTDTLVFAGQPDDIVSIAAAEVGYLETTYPNSNVFWSKYGDWYGIPNGAWCAMFLSWCANQAGISTDIIPRFSLVGDGVSWFQNRGLWKDRGSYTPQRGDIIFFSSPGHVGIVESCSNNVVYTIEGNVHDGSGYNYGVRRLNYSLSNTKIQGYGTPKYDNNPQGVVDVYEGRTGAVHIRGWAFDNDDSSQSLDIHVYIGGNSSASGGEGHVITANQSRPDVNNVYGISGNHGFDNVITTSKTGSQPVYVYAINIGSGDNTLIGHGTVTIAADSENPTITNIRITDSDSGGYTIRCHAEDNVSINRVEFPTRKPGVAANWIKGSNDGNGEYSVRINYNEFNVTEGDILYTHIYAWDDSGNAASANAGIRNVDLTAPVITNVSIIDMDSTGYTIKCYIEDNFSINRVLFPTWTAFNGQDDIGDNWSGELSNGTATYRINFNEHNNENGYYITNIYAFDECDNQSVCVFGYIAGEDNYTPIIRKQFNGNTYIVYDNQDNINCSNIDAYCRAQGGHLVTITSKEENDFIKSIIPDSKPYYFIGCQDTKSEGIWEWVTGEPFDYTNWSTGEPNNSNNEDYGCIGANGFWNDVKGSSGYGFICEIEGEADMPIEASVKANVTTSGLNLINSASADISNLALKALEPTAIFVYKYADGSIAHISTQTAAVGSKAAVTVSDSVSNKLTEINDRFITSVEVYVWNGIESLMPMAYKSTDVFNYD